VRLLPKSFFSQTFVVTGGTGFVGSNLVRYLLDNGAKVISVSLSRSIEFDHKNLEALHLDLTLPDSWSRLLQGRSVDVLIHLAAVSSGAAIMKESPLAHLTPNVIMNALMLEAAYKHEIKKVSFLSSNTVYPLTDYPVKEVDSGFDFYHSYHVVGWMKKFSEVMCEMYSSHVANPMDVLVVRPGNLYGPFDKFDPEKSKVIPALIRRALSKQDPFEVWGDGSDIKDFLYIDDFVKVFVSLLAYDNVGGPVNIASGRSVSLRDVIFLILELAGHADVAVKFDQTKPIMIPKRLIDITLLENITGFKPAIDLREGLRRTIDWYVENS